MIRTRNPSKLSTADPRLRRCGHWDRLHKNVNWNLLWAIRIQYIYFNIFYFSFLNMNVGPQVGIYHIRYLTLYLSKEHDVRTFSFLHAYYIFNPSHFYLTTSLPKTRCIHCKNLCNCINSFRFLLRTSGNHPLLMRISFWERLLTETLFNRLFSEWKNKLYARRNEHLKLQTFFIFEISETRETRKFSFYPNHNRYDFSDYNIPEFCSYYNILIFIAIPSAITYSTLIIILTYSFLNICGKVNKRNT